MAVNCKDENKLHNISNSQVMGIIGDQGYTAQFTQFITKNIQLYKIRNNYQLSTTAAVHFIRKNLLDMIRSAIFCTQTIRKEISLPVDILIAGYDEDDGGGQLHTVDSLASTLRVPFGVHGFGGLICMSILDKYYKPTLTEPEAYNIIKLCVQEIHKRLFLNLANFQVKVVDKHGIKTLPVINPATFVLDSIT